MLVFKIKVQPPVSNGGTPPDLFFVVAGRVHSSIIGKPRHPSGLRNPPWPRRRRCETCFLSFSTGPETLLRATVHPRPTGIACMAFVIVGLSNSMPCGYHPLTTLFPSIIEVAELRAATSERISSFSPENIATDNYLPITVRLPKVREYI